MEEPFCTEQREFRSDFAVHPQTECKIWTLRNLVKQINCISSDISLAREKMKYLTKVLHEVNDYLMSIINTITQQELNDSQNENRRAETNKTPNKTYLILPYSGKQGKKLITKMKKHQEKSTRSRKGDSSISK